MKELKRILLAVFVGAIIAASAFAQKPGDEKRPPKERPKVQEREKEKPPPSNNNGNSNKRGKP